MRVTFLLVPLLAASAVAGGASQSQPLEPSSKWVVEYGEQRCTLWRKFGEGDQQALLSIEQAGPRRSRSVMIAGSAVPKISGTDNTLTFAPLDWARIDSGQAVVTTKGKENGVYFTRNFASGKLGLIPQAEAKQANELEAKVKFADRDWSRPSRAEFEADSAAFDQRAEQVRVLVLNSHRKDPTMLRTGSLRAPLRALEKCAEDSLKDWGIDPAIEAKVATNARPLRDPLKIFTANDYPDRAINAGKQSSLELWLNIDAGGAISSCRVISTFAAPEIHKNLCKLMQERQKFAPARTTDGTAVPSYYIESIRFVLQG